MLLSDPTIDKATEQLGARWGQHGWSRRFYRVVAISCVERRKTKHVISQLYTIAKINNPPYCVD